VSFFFGHFVVAVLLPADLHPRMREPVSGFTWSAASVSGTDAEAMSGGLVLAGFEGADSALDCFRGRLHSEHPLWGCPVYAGLPGLVAPHFQRQISGKASPYLSLDCLCSISLSLSCCFR